MSGLFSRFLHVASYALATFVPTLFMAVATALGVAYGEEPPTRPPYLVSGSDHVLVGVVWDEAAVRKVLPSWLPLAKDMTGVIDISQTGEVYGLAPYQAAYFAVDLEGLDSSSDIKGRWILQGVYGPLADASIAFGYWYGLPVRNGTSRLVPTAEGKRAIGTVNGQDFVTVEIKPLEKTCKPDAFALNYITPEGLIEEIAVAGEVCAAEPVSVEVYAPPGDPFAAFRPIKVLWAVEYRNSAFAITRGIPLHH